MHWIITAVLLLWAIPSTAKAASIEEWQAVLREYEVRVLKVWDDVYGHATQSAYRKGLRSAFVEMCQLGEKDTPGDREPFIPGFDLERDLSVLESFEEGRAKGLERYQGMSPVDCALNELSGVHSANRFIADRELEMYKAADELRQFLEGDGVLFLRRMREGLKGARRPPDIADSALGEDWN